MKIPIYKHINRRIYDFIRRLDTDPEHKRPVHFYFYAEEESDIYRLAEELKQMEFKILEVSDVGAGDEPHSWLCVAEMHLIPEPSIMDRCADLLIDLAERYDSMCDGWETRIDL